MGSRQMLPGCFAWLGVVSMVAAGSFLGCTSKNDGGSSTTSSDAGGGGADTGVGGHGGHGVGGSAPTPIHFGVMLHLEGGLQLPDEQQFQLFDAATREVVDLFATHGGKITVESEMPFAEAASTWASTDNALLYALSNGHGVGSHCDTIGDQTAATDFAAHRAAVDAVVGAENNLGCSGGWVRTDWAQSAVLGGFAYLDGVVMFAYLAVPEANRPVNPDTGLPYTDDEIQQIYYHDPAPPDLMDRIYPRRLATTDNLDGDSDGDLLLLTGELGEISSLYEGRSNCFPNCVLTQDDFDVVLDTIDQVYASKDHSRFAMMYLHFPLETLGPDPSGTSSPAEKRALAEAWLGQMRALETDGKIAWVTQKEAYEQFAGSR